MLDIIIWLVAGIGIAVAFLIFAYRTRSRKPPLATWVRLAVLAWILAVAVTVYSLDEMSWNYVLKLALLRHDEVGKFDYLNIVSLYLCTIVLIVFFLALGWRRARHEGRHRLGQRPTGREETK
jgi:uncharacterized membrane protein